MILPHFKYLWYVLRHKWYVLLACKKYGCLRRALTHDLSKFLPSEWGPYVDYFHREKTDRTIRRFKLAFLYHQHRNPHHWQFWLMRQNDGTLQAFEMPEIYAREMVADWSGAGMAIHGKDECLPWYLGNRQDMHLHPNTRVFVEELLEVPESERWAE